ncbi:MAG: hypothetical protein RLZZ435_1289 [Cyanobacteriota bacterium]
MAGGFVAYPQPPTGKVMALSTSNPPVLSAPQLWTEAQQQVPGVAFRADANLSIALDQLVNALAQEAELHAVGTHYFHEFLLRLLTNHLKLQAEYDRHPEIQQVPLQRPLFVVGLFRSGTTFLHNLLSQDPRCRWLSVAEALYPTPAPHPEQWQTDPRIAAAIEHISFQSSLAPKFSAAHHINAIRPAECSRLFEHDLIGHLFDFRAHVPSYSHWVLQQELTEAYRSYRQQLQYLSWHWPHSHWVLKAPAHLFALDTLLTVFPDAAIVYLHRDPLQVLPSCCSLAATGRSRFSDRVDSLKLGAHWLALLQEAVNRGMKTRDTTQPMYTLYDVSYNALLKNPQETIANIYQHFHYDFTPEMAQQLQTWITDNPQHKHGVHRYTLDQFGLSPDQIKATFADYYDRFQEFLE